ncbi:MAG: hypothetical protein WBC91_12225 [Phototrophicaceae bacterium]
MKKKKIMIEPDWGMDIGKIPQFEIRHIEVRDTLLYVLGVAHSAIKIGDRFNKVIRFAPQTNTQDALGDEIANINVKVQTITAYHKHLNRINTDMTAGLELVGVWDTLLDALTDAGWVTDYINSHQWREYVLDSEKLILTK